MVLSSRPVVLWSGGPLVLWSCGVVVVVVVVVVVSTSSNGKTANGKRQTANGKTAKRQTAKRQTANGKTANGKRQKGKRQTAVVRKVVIIVSCYVLGHYLLLVVSLVFNLMNVLVNIFSPCSVLRTYASNRPPESFCSSLDIWILKSSKVEIQKTFGCMCRMSLWPRWSLVF